jgi:DNA invertase Pin-like site-specific DNA recombinase
MGEKYFLYARKSTDVEDKQVLSIEAQLVELRAYARQESLQVIDELIEKQSAKIPGRPIFGGMLKRIEAGEASGILAWHPDRLARNSIDGGRIVYLLDQTHLTSLKFPTFWFDNTSQGKFMLSIAFGQSKYYVDNLAENTKRGLRQKVRRGEYPSHAPLGYINDLRTKGIVVDKRRSPLVKQAFELYAKGDQRLEDIADFFAKNGIKTSGNKPLKKDQIKHILANPFYYGHFRYVGELYEGKHTPIMSKKLFDKVQSVLELRGRPRKTKHNNPKVFCGLLRCGSCGLMITGETRTKHQKNGNVHQYVYYHCTKKRKDMKCLEPHIRQEELDSQLSSLLNEYALPDSWTISLTKMLDTDEQQAEQSTGVFIADTTNRIGNLQSKLQRLLDSYLDQDIDRETYLQKKAELMSQRKSLEEQNSKLTLTSTAWVEPMRNWLKQANSICEITKNTDLEAKKALAKEIFGSNLILKSQKAQPTAAPNVAHPPENIWYLLRKSKEKAALSGDDFQFSTILAGARAWEYNFFR